MGIEFRRDRAFYYHKRRVGSRVVSEYAGGGVLALVAMERAEEERAERAAADAAWRAERARMEEEERAAVAYCDRVEAQVREMLTAMGYHRPKRQWRKRRVDTNTTTTAAAPGEIGMDLLNRAIDGEEGPQKQLIGLMKDPEVGGKVVDFFGDMSRYAERVAIAEVAGEGPQGPLVSKAMQQKLSSLRAELAGPDPTPIERLLAERAAYCWFAVWKYEHTLVNSKDLPARREEFHHRRIDAANRRYLSSLRALATVRKLAVPEVRVTIGPHQHHQAEPSPPCTCHGHNGSGLPTFADRLSAIR